MADLANIDLSLRFGELNPDGSIKRDVRICAITGQPVESGDAMVRVVGTNKFYRAKAPLMWPQSQPQYAQAHEQLVALATASQPTSTKASAPVVPATDKGANTNA